MRFGCAIGTFALISSSVCWSFPDSLLSSSTFSGLELKAPLEIPFESTFRLPELLNGDAIQLKDEYSYKINLRVFDTQVTAQINNTNNLEQTTKVELPSLRHRRDLQSAAQTFLESLLALLASRGNTAEIRYDLDTRNTIITTGKQTIETTVTPKHSTRNDLPLLLENDAVKQLFYAVECALAFEGFPEGDYPCQRGLVNLSGSNRTTFAARSEYEPVPTSLYTEEYPLSVQFPFNDTTQIVLTLNSDNTIASGETYSKEPEINTLNKGRNKKSNHGHGDRAKKTTDNASSSVSSLVIGLFYYSRNSGFSGGSGDGNDPEKPNKELDRTPSDKISFDDDDKEEDKGREEALIRSLRFEWPAEEKALFWNSLSSTEKQEYEQYLGPGDEYLVDSGIDSSSSNEYPDEDDFNAQPTHIQSLMSQYSDGSGPNSSGQKNKMHKGYVGDGRRQKAWDNAGDGSGNNEDNYHDHDSGG